MDYRGESILVSLERISVLPPKLLARKRLQATKLTRYLILKMASATRTFARAATRATTRNAFAVAPRQVFRQQGRRFYSSEPAQKSGSNAFLLLGGAAVLGGAGYWFYANSAADATPKVFTPTKEDYQKVYNEIAARLEEKDDYDDGSYGPVLVRLAWHASGTYDKLTNTGGSNGATMRFAPESDHGANAGLVAARDFLQPVKEKNPWITYSDLWILAGVCALQEMQGPIIPYRPGRADRDMAACTPDGRLPDASQGSDHLRNIFYRMGFNDQEIVALSGAHALGRCHTDRSGFSGPWTFSPTVLTNDYYRLLLEEKWQWKKWNGPKQYEDKTTKTLMMLPTDVVLTKDKAFRPWVEKYAKDNDVFFKDFSDVVLKLFELGVPFAEGTENQRWVMKPTWDESK
ncbi:Cytochrome c peroxidase [Paramyrothecium foliicola]|nr:Cytochrome c peroxidase [Paramyrothecium foliicola]